MRLEKIFDKLIKCIFILIFSWIIICLVFYSRVDYHCKKQFLVSNFCICLCTFILFCFLKFFKRKIPIKDLTKFNNINFDKVVYFLFFVFFLIQLYVFYHIFFETGWDSGWYIIPNARAILGSKNINLNYYSWFPNNLMITSFYALILGMNAVIGIFGMGYDLMSIVFINSLLSSFSSLLVYKIAQRFLNKKYAFIGYIISVILFVLSPWNVICYSDSLAIFIPILIFYIYLSDKLNMYFKWPLIFLFGYIGYSIKPQSIMIFFAIIVITFIRKISFKNLKKMFVIFLLSLCPVLIINFGLDKLYKFEGFKLDSEKQIGITHFLMMGANPATDGVFYDKDANYSISIKNRSERSKKNINVYLKRVRKYGLIGYIKFLSKKNLVNYNDGTFAWGVEGGFYDVLKPEISKISNLFRKIFYDNGSLFIYYSSFVQIIWVTTLFIITIGSFYSFRKNKLNYNYLILILSIIFLTIFELLFEGRARYLYCNLPIFILLMLYSLNYIFEGGSRNEK